MSEKVYKPKNKIRIVTAASLFDGHDAAINIMRRIIQSTGCEVIHLGHDRSVEEVVNCAIQEDANAIAMTSYQGGHNEYLKYMFDLLKKKKSSHIKIFAGGGGTILPEEIKDLHKYGITKIYHPDDGRKMGLQGMINDLVKKSDFPLGNKITGCIKDLNLDNNISRLISAAENYPKIVKKDLTIIKKLSKSSKIPVLGITGTGGAGKSSLVDELLRRFLNDFKEKKIGVICVDPSKRKSGGALLGDRIRMNSSNNPRIYMRSLATRQANLALSAHVNDAIAILKAANFDLIILETSGIGQSDTEILDHSDISLYVMTPEYGAATQLEKIDMLDFADIISINKFDRRGSLDALRDVKKQYQRNNNLFSKNIDSMPVFGTIASQFNDPGLNNLYNFILRKINDKNFKNFSSSTKKIPSYERICIIPQKRIRYLSEISDENRSYNTWVDEQKNIASEIYNLNSTKKILEKENTESELLIKIKKVLLLKEQKLNSENKKLIKQWDNLKKLYKNPTFKFNVRKKEISIKNFTKSLSNIKVPKVSLPKYKDFGDILKWQLQENVPGKFPFTSGIFPFKREGEDPTRMFAGEGGPERTNKRFHYLSSGMPAKRLSTAFDSVTLYGNDPDYRPDIYGKIGNAGVSICCLDDAKKLYSGFNLVDSLTSVSMTINGPAPIILAFFLNAAIDQQCEIYIKENSLEKVVNKKIKSLFKNKKRPKYSGKLPPGNNGLGLMLLGLTGQDVIDKKVYEKIKKQTLNKVRGTVQADILKEDQAQNTCIFSTEFSLKVMGDIQEYFIKKNIKNFYSVSISGYHIAEAGANPITQLAFTLANGFTYIEYYLSRGMKIDEFASNLSFFFSNGIDPEYAVIGRVARRIWAKAIKYKYRGNERSQLLKYHIQTSGRSLHAQEIDFNDIRTTLQALYAIYDNCNSLHTNAYDEAITTPTEESVRRAVAIQLIINKELGLTKNENPLQGSFIIEELTELVEKAVLDEFDRITERGGVLGAMETMYQRSKIQEESLHYESLKHSGELPIIGVNTFLNTKGSPTIIPEEVIRSTEIEKENQIDTVTTLKENYSKVSEEKLNILKYAVTNNENIFSTLMETSKYCTLGQISNVLFEVGGKYRRNM
ncbi:MAG: methylmalonyl-CoA mutase family protein [Bacteroidota bacterium]|nr:methylmalonyl-CoA mutase family protein [Bacteroidota bacterium]